jgi:hypothetical protein
MLDISWILFPCDLLQTKESQLLSIIYSQLNCVQSWHSFIFAFTKFLSTSEDFKPSWDKSELFGGMLTALLRAGTIGTDEHTDGASKLYLEHLLRIDAIVGQILLIAEHDFGATSAPFHRGLQAMASTIDSMLTYPLGSQEVGLSLILLLCLSEL